MLRAYASYLPGARTGPGLENRWEIISSLTPTRVALCPDARAWVQDVVWVVALLGGHELVPERSEVALPILPR